MSQDDVLPFDDSEEDALDVYIDTSELDNYDESVKTTTDKSNAISKIKSKIQRYGITKSAVKDLEELGAVESGISNHYTDAAGQVDLHNILGNEAINLKTVGIVAGLVVLLMTFVARFSKLNGDRKAAVKSRFEWKTKFTFDANAKEKAAYEKTGGGSGTTKNSLGDHSYIKIEDLDTKLLLQHYPALGMNPKNVTHGGSLAIQGKVISGMASMVKAMKPIEASRKIANPESLIDIVMSAVDEVAKFADGYKGGFKTLDDHRDFIRSIKSTGNLTYKGTIEERLKDYTITSVVEHDLRVLKEQASWIDDMLKAQLSIADIAILKEWCSGGSKVMMEYYKALSIIPANTMQAFMNKASALDATFVTHYAAIRRNHISKGLGIDDVSIMYKQAIADGAITTFHAVEKDLPRSDKDVYIALWNAKLFNLK